MNYWTVNLEKRSIKSRPPVPLGTFFVGSDRSNLPNLEAFLSSLLGEDEYLKHEPFKPVWIADDEALADRGPVFTGADFTAWKVVHD